MTDLLDRQTCTYCGQDPAPEKDHVIARQFFPKAERFRGYLPKVPCCGTCNRAKQRIEDRLGVLFQFGHASEASRRVLTERVPRTLQKNADLTRSLKAGLQRVVVHRESGLLVPGLGIALTDRDLCDAHDWYRLITRGLYRFESGKNLPADNLVHLLRPVSRKQCKVLVGLIRGDPSHQYRSLADGEFQYLFAISTIDTISAWFYLFKSIDMSAATLGPACSANLKELIERMAWERPGNLGSGGFR